MDSYTAILSKDSYGTISTIKKCISRFREAYLNGYKLSGAYARVRVKGRLIVGYICSSEARFHYSEAVWRWLHCYRVIYGREYFEDHPREIKDFVQIEENCIAEIDKTINEKPISACADTSRLIQAFDMMVHLAHLGPVDEEHPEPSFDPQTSFLQGNWFEVNPWRLPRGRSMLIDYWYNIPLDLRLLGHMVLDRLASSQIKSVEDLLKLRRETEEWKPDADQGSA